MTSTEEVAELLLRLSSSSSSSFEPQQDGDERSLAIRPRTQVSPTGRSAREDEPSGSKLSLQFILNGSDQAGSSQSRHDEPEQAITTTRSSSLGNCYTVASAEDGPVEGIANFHEEGTAGAASTSSSVAALHEHKKKRRRRKHSDTHHPEGKRAKLHGYRGSSRKKREAASETQPRNGLLESGHPSSFSSSLSFSTPSSSHFSSWGRPSAESSAAPSYWLPGPQGQTGGATLDHVQQLQSSHAPPPPLAHSFAGFPPTGHHSGHLPSASSSLPPFVGAHQYTPAPSLAPASAHTMSEDLLKAEEILRRRLLHIHQQRELLLHQLHHGQASARYGHPPEPSTDAPTPNKRPSSSPNRMERRTRKRSVVAHPDDRRPITVALGE